MISCAGHVLVGRVVRGRRLGRKLGFPTANLDLRPHSTHTHLPLGIYAAGVRVLADDALQGLPAAVSVGVRPTFESDGNVIVEVHLIDWEGDLYGRDLEVTLLRFLREEQAFDSAEALVEQIERDVRAALDVHRQFVAKEAP